MGKITRRAVAFVLATCIVLGNLCVAWANVTLQSAVSDNAESQNYSYWASPVRSYLLENENGGLTRVEYIKGEIVVEDYDLQMNLLSARSITPELPLFGGFYSGTDYHFFVFGQENPEESQDKEVLRVVKYSKDWKRIDAVSLCGANTSIPFNASSLRMVQTGDMLYIRTAHQMFVYVDGYHHQASMTVCLRISDMKITDTQHFMSNIIKGYVSHSFNQFVAVDENRFLVVDHGDGSPRAVCLLRNSFDADSGEFGIYSKVDVLKIKGNNGNNATGVSVGGFEVTKDAYIITGNSVVQDDNFDPDGQRNIFVATVDKQRFTESGVSLQWLTSYTDGCKVSAPKLVKLDNGKLMLMWTENDTELCYTFLNTQGKQVGEIYRACARLSDCQPIVVNGKVYWYATDHGTPVTFVVNQAKPQNVQVLGGNFTLSFHPCSGELQESASRTITFGQTYGSLPTPRRANYAFLGWYTGTHQSAVQVFEDSTFTELRDFTLYARWQYHPHTCNYERTVEREATCVLEGIYRYTCSVCAASYTETYDTPVTHNFCNWHTNGSVSCTVGMTEERKCADCGLTETRYVPPHGHDYSVSFTEPTCETEGYSTFYCEHCGNTYKGDFVPAKGHSMSNWIDVEMVSCTQDGVQRRECTVCPYYETRGEKAYGHSYTLEVTDPSCTQPGYANYNCTRCGEGHTEELAPPLGHDCLAEVTQPSCAEQGYTVYTCKRCGESHTAEYTQPLGHEYAAQSLAPTCVEQGGVLHRCIRCEESYLTNHIAPIGHDWDNGVVVTKPTVSRTGVRCYTCSRCETVGLETIPMLERCDGTECACCVLGDVKTTDWYHVAVDFVTQRKLFFGTSDTEFSPNDSMTRAMLVTVLWRYADKLIEGENNFADVPNGQWYSEAVTWAAHHGVVAGVGAGLFNPDGKITREQMAAILYRYAEKVGIDTSKRAPLDFPDANKTSSYAREAMQWAVAEGLISGTRINGKLYLDPSGNATRAQVASILMRFVQNISEADNS